MRKSRLKSEETGYYHCMPTHHASLRHALSKFPSVNLRRG